MQMKHIILSVVVFGFVAVMGINYAAKYLDDYQKKEALKEKCKIFRELQNQLNCQSGAFSI